MSTLITNPRFAGLRRLLFAALAIAALLPNFGFYQAVAAPATNIPAAIETPPACAHVHKAMHMEAGQWNAMTHRLDEVGEGFNIDYGVAAKRLYTSKEAFSIDGEEASPILDGQVVIGWSLQTDQSQHMEHVTAVETRIIVFADPDHSGDFQTYWPKAGCE